MRIQVTLRPSVSRWAIPINYQYPVAAAIYRLLSLANPEYSNWLHSQGYLAPDGRPMKLFVFSRLNIHEKPKVDSSRNLLLANNRSRVTLYISSPMLQDFIENFVCGMFMDQIFSIGNRNARCDFQIENIQALPSISLEQWVQMAAAGSLKFRCLSSIVASVKEKDAPTSKYLQPGEAKLEEIICRNLVRKFFAVSRRAPKNGQLHFIPDQDYIASRGGKRISKAITICEGDEHRQTCIRSFITPFQLAGNPELIWCAYECGIGEKNSLGFGMIELESS